jgi:hypothetical protein
MRFPKEFPFNSKKWLGNFVEAVRDAAPGSKLAALKPFYNELDDINSYSQKFHHSGWESAVVDEGELRSHVSRTLDLIAGL